MLFVKIKICGLTNYEDAAAALDMGADMLGFNFYPKSPRYVDPKKAADIIAKIPAFTDIVGVFVNETYDNVRKTVDNCQLCWAQFHGDETPEYVRDFRTFNIKTMKAVRVRDSHDVDYAMQFHTDAILLDAYDPKKYGGTGISFDWNVIGDMTKRVFLAGGINPDNVIKAVELGVYGIDVCSGIESKTGIKDHKKMKQLFDNVRHLRA